MTGKRKVEHLIPLTIKVVKHAFADNLDVLLQKILTCNRLLEKFTHKARLSIWTSNMWKLLGTVCKTTALIVCGRCLTILWSGNLELDGEASHYGRKTKSMQRITGMALTKAMSYCFSQILETFCDRLSLHMVMEEMPN